jgi:hypothetical protein
MCNQSYYVIDTNLRHPGVIEKNHMGTVYASATRGKTIWNMANPDVG